MKARLAFVLAACVSLIAAAPQSEAEPEIRTSDVDRFFALYDSTGGKPAAEQLQAYIDAGSEGFRAFTNMRNTTGERIAEAIEKRPEIYVKAKQCAAVLPAVKRRLATALVRLKELYPEAKLAPVTLSVGRGRPLGTADRNGVMIGQEVMCTAEFMNPHVEDRFVYVIAHEYAHVQQAQLKEEDPEETVLEATLIEGGAELMGELISGSVSYRHLPAAVKGREKAFEAAFLAEVDKTARGSRWLYNYPGTPKHPADLGYWIGYRIKGLLPERQGQAAGAARRYRTARSEDLSSQERLASRHSAGLTAGQRRGPRSSAPAKAGAQSRRSR